MTDTTKRRDVAGILHFLTPQQMAEEIVRLDAVLAGRKQDITMGRLPHALLAAAPAPQQRVATLQFLSDVHTAAGLLAHGRQDKALAARLGEGVMALHPLYAAPQAQPAQQDAKDAARINTQMVEEAARQMGYSPVPGSFFILAGALNALLDRAAMSSTQQKGEA